jgi:hypothetical protein
MACETTSASVVGLEYMLSTGARTVARGWASRVAAAAESKRMRFTIPKIPQPGHCVANRIEWMERVVTIFRSHQEAEKFNRAYYLSLTPSQRVKIALELRTRLQDSNDESAQRLARVLRVVKRGGR